MPAGRERLYICPRENGQPGWILDFPAWWNRRAFFKKYGDRRIDTGDLIYVDYGMLLTGTEARMWDKDCKDPFSRIPRGQRPHIREAMRNLQSKLQTVSWVIVESYEWESGLD
ncbi:MAG: hypothetical protein R3293_28950 [Candidatus Promineifilaceae bacterium]|nr:hypothetical protein [Candidatus Promineifilaceae bacterium]